MNAYIIFRVKTVSFFRHHRDSICSPLYRSESHEAYSRGIHNKLSGFCLIHVAVESVHAEWVRARAIFSLFWAGCDVVFLPCMGIQEWWSEGKYTKGRWITERCLNDKGFTGEKQDKGNVDYRKVYLWGFRKDDLKESIIKDYMDYRKVFHW